MSLYAEWDEIERLIRDEAEGVLAAHDPTEGPLHPSQLEWARETAGKITDAVMCHLDGYTPSDIAELTSGDRPAPDPATWGCKIGEIARSALPMGADAPMRRAVAAAYRELTGEEPDFIYSGWAAELDNYERQAQDSIRAGERTTASEREEN